MAQAQFLGYFEKTVELLPAQSSTTTPNSGTGINRMTYDHLLAILDIGTLSGGTSPTVDVKIQDSADNSTFADYTPDVVFDNNKGGLSQAGNVVAAFPTQTAAGIVKLDVNLEHARKYIRAVATIGGSPTGVVYSVTGFLGMQASSNRPGATA
jgi:hypothetical protein